MRTLRVVAVVLLLAGGCADGNDPSAQTGPTTPATESPPPLQGASCDAQTGGDEDAAMLLTDVRFARQPGFDRVVFEFEPRSGEPAVIPFHEVDVATPPLVEDPSGEELDVDGEAFLGIVVFASGVDLSGETFREVYTGPKRITPSDGRVVAEVREGGDFENTMTWYVGLARDACFVVSSLTDPVRVIVDIESGA